MSGQVFDDTWQPGNPEGIVLADMCHAAESHRRKILVAEQTKCTCSYCGRCCHRKPFPTGLVIRFVAVVPTVAAVAVAAARNIALVDSWDSDLADID